MPRSDTLVWLPSPKWAVALLALLISLLLVSGTAFVLKQLRADALKRAQAEIRGLSEVLAEQSSRSFEGATVALMAVQQRLSDNIGQRLGLDSFPVNALLSARTAGLPQLRSMFLIDAAGQTVNTSLASGPPAASLADRDYFRHFAAGGEGIYISGPVQSRADDSWTLIIACRLGDRDGGFRGVLAVSLAVGYFESFYSSLEAVDRLHIMLIDATGAHVVASPAAGRSVGAPVANFPRELLHGAAQQVVELTEPVAGGRRFVAYKPVPGYPFVMGLSIEEAVALHDWPQTARPIVGGAGAVVMVVLAAAAGLIWALHRREAMVLALRDSDERNRQLVESVRDAIVMMDEELEVVLFNPAAEALFGIASGHAIGCPLAVFLAPESRHLCVDLLERCRRVGSSEDLRLRQSEIHGLHASGRRFPADASFSTTLVQGRRVFTLVLRDLTERRRIEADLRATNARVQSLAAAMQNVREEERAGIAREMHDELGQQLTGIKLELSWLKGRLPAERDDLKRKAGVIQDQLGQTIASVRRIIQQLRPLILDDLGLLAAMSWLADDFARRTGIETILEAGPDEPPRGSIEATTLFRVLQESLTNVAKHARASTAWIHFRREAGAWKLSIRDDGVGFDVGEAGKSGFGLVGMRERVRLSGGDVRVSSVEGEATQVEATIPAMDRE